MGTGSTGHPESCCLALRENSRAFLALTPGRGLQLSCLVWSGSPSLEVAGEGQECRVGYGRWPPVPAAGREVRGLELMQPSWT